MLDITESYNLLRQNILANAGVNVSPRSVTSDLFLVPTANEITRLTVLTSFVSKMQSFDGIVTLLGDTYALTTISTAMNATVSEVRTVISGTLDKLAGNYNKTRKTSTAATGIVSIYRYTAPSSTEYAQAISAGAVFTGTNGLTYASTEDRPISAVYYDQLFRVYMLDLPVQCTSGGIASNTDIGTITVFSGLPNWSGSTNKIALTNGTDAETDITFASRLKLEVSGSNISTYNGLQVDILQNTAVTDLILVGAGDAGMHRDLGAGGMVDIYISDIDMYPVTWSFVYDGSDATYISGQRPLCAGGSTTVSSGNGVVGTAVSDTRSVWAGSVRSRDYVTWTTKPGLGDTVTLSYFVNKRIIDVQNYVNNDARRAGADVLIKQARMVPIDIMFSIAISANYSKASLITQIKATLNAYINSLRLGEVLDQSDVIYRATLPGVDRIVLPMSKFNRAALTGSVDRIEAAADEYLRINSIIIS